MGQLDFGKLGTIKPTHWLLSFSLIANVMLVPLAINEYLRYIYMETLANWESKIHHPNTVYIGDSITAGGRMFNSLQTINLGSSGLQTFQIAGEITKANTYSPHYIAVMAGTNDAVRDINVPELTALWEQMAADPKLVISLVPHTRVASMNSRIDAINKIAQAAAQKYHRPVVTLYELNGTDGLIQPKYTVDGVHLTDSAIEIWKRKLKSLGV